MEFLKAILGEDLYKQIETAINAHNGNEANKDKQIKLANLASGEYVGKGKHDALQTLLDGKNTELETANNLIAELKKGNKDNEGLQTKITDYEAQIQQLQEQLAKTQLESAIKVELLAAKALDVDYLTFKLNEKGELSLDENGKIKGWEDKLAGLKTQFPNQFESAGGEGGNGGFEPFKPNKLGRGEGGDNVTKEKFMSMSYEERMNLKQNNEARYKELVK
jgi:hypothetical protein